MHRAAAAATGAPVRDVREGVADVERARWMLHA